MFAIQLSGKANKRFLFHFRNKKTKNTKKTTHNVLMFTCFGSHPRHREDEEIICIVSPLNFLWRFENIFQCWFCTKITRENGNESKNAIISFFPEVFLPFLSSTHLVTRNWLHDKLGRSELFNGFRYAGFLVHQMILYSWVNQSVFIYPLAGFKVMVKDANKLSFKSIRYSLQKQP